MTKRLKASMFVAALLIAAPAATVAQVWVPGSEIAGQSIVVETNGVANTVHFDPGGAARIVSPSGKTVNATWTAANGNLCLNTGAAQECWPYTQAFQAGQRVTLTSNCQAVSNWLPNGTNASPPPPVQDNLGERG